jgi:hypothetical protein
MLLKSENLAFFGVFRDFQRRVTGLAIRRCFLPYNEFMSKKVQKIISNEAADLAEPLFDKASTELVKGLFGAVLPEIIKDLPVLKYIKTAGDIYGAYRISKLQHSLRQFLRALLEGNFNLEDYYRLPEAEQRQIIDILTTELDNQTDDRQAEALGLLFNAYISRTISTLIFIGLTHELKNINPLVFSSDEFKITRFGKDMRNIRIEGPVHYLPNSFYSNSNGQFSFSTDLLLTNLGEAYFDYVYNPMLKKTLQDK